MVSGKQFIASHCWGWNREQALPGLFFAVSLLAVPCQHTPHQVTRFCCKHRHFYVQRLQCEKNQTKLFPKGTPYVCIPVGVMPVLRGLTLHWTRMIEIALSTKILRTFLSVIFTTFYFYHCFTGGLNWSVDSFFMTLYCLLVCAETWDHHANGSHTIWTMWQRKPRHRTHSNTPLKWPDWPWS